jgi:plasmid maintenance system antidote protein VapI
MGICGEYGCRDITADTALPLTHFFGTSAEFWIKLQTLYDLRLAQQQAGKTTKVLPALKRTSAVQA